MKKMKKAAIIIAAAALACGAVALSACSKDGGSSGQINQNEWQQRLTINTESYDSVTLTVEDYNTYSKSEAETYGEWESHKYVTKINKTANVIYTLNETERYNPTNENAVDGFVKETRETYSFEYNGKYYSWSESNKSTWDLYGVYEMTMAEFINNIESANSEITMLSVYSNPQMYSMFNYNSQTQTYELIQGGMSVGLQFPSTGGVKLISQYTSIEKGELSLENLNSTTVTVPQQAYTDVDAYLANKNS